MIYDISQWQAALSEEAHFGRRRGDTALEGTRLWPPCLPQALWPITHLCTVGNPRVCLCVNKAQSAQLWSFKSSPPSFLCLSVFPPAIMLSPSDRSLRSSHIVCSLFSPWSCQEREKKACWHGGGPFSLGSRPHTRDTGKQLFAG